MLPGSERGGEERAATGGDGERVKGAPLAACARGARAALRQQGEVAAGRAVPSVAFLLPLTPASVAKKSEAVIGGEHRVFERGKGAAGVAREIGDAGERRVRRGDEAANMPRAFCRVTPVVPTVSDPAKALWPRVRGGEAVAREGPRRRRPDIRCARATGAALRKHGDHASISAERIAWMLPGKVTIASASVPAGASSQPRPWPGEPLPTLNERSS